MPYYPERKPEPSGEKQRNTTAAEKRNRLLRLSVAAFFSLLVLYGAIRLFRYQSELNESRKNTAELRRIQNLEEIKTESTDLLVPKETVTAAAVSPVPAATTIPSPEASSDRLEAVSYPDNPKWKVSERFRKLRKKGKYIIGWVSFDEVDEAVCQKDNTYFLNHDATGKRNTLAKPASGASTTASCEAASPKNTGLEKSKSSINSL